MLSQVAIVNLALIDIGAATITSMDETSNEATKASALWAPIRDEVLVSHHWDFATVAVDLALESDFVIVDEKWQYSYAIPSDCLEPRYLGLKDYNYEVRGTHILCDIEDAQLIYTAKITDTTKYPAMFDTALAKRLGAALCRPLKKRGSTAREMMGEYEVAISLAQNRDASQSNMSNDDKYRHTVNNDTWLQARYI